MVFAVQCPNPNCRKYMLVEEHDRNKVVACLLCRTAIKVTGGQAPAGASKKTPMPKP
jgi:hypothetical protein